MLIIIGFQVFSKAVIRDEVIIWLIEGAEHLERGRLLKMLKIF